MKETILTLDLRWIKLQTNPITSLFHLSSDKVVQIGLGGVLDFQVQTWNEVLFQRSPKILMDWDYDVYESPKIEKGGSQYVPDSRLEVRKCLRSQIWVQTSFQAILPLSNLTRESRNGEGGCLQSRVQTFCGRTSSEFCRGELNEPFSSVLSMGKKQIFMKRKVEGYRCNEWRKKEPKIKKKTDQKMKRLMT